MRWKFFAAFFLASFIEVSAQVPFETSCPVSCSAICGRGEGATSTEAEEAADKRIAEKINSSSVHESIDRRSVERKSGSVSEQRQYASNSTVESHLKNNHDVKNYRAAYEENGIFVAERYICNSAAAKPYLNELRHLKDSLRISVQKVNRETCGGMLGVYNRIRIYEGIAENLGQMDKSLKKEYDAFYEEMKNECRKIGRGVYIKSDLDYFKKEIGSFLTKNGCQLSPSEGEANLSLVLDAEEKINSMYGSFHCFASVEIDLQSNKTGKSIDNGNINEKGSWTDRETACKEAYKKIASKLWDKIKEKIQKEGCK